MWTKIEKATHICGAVFVLLFAILTLDAVFSLFAGFDVLGKSNIYVLAAIPVFAVAFFFLHVFRKTYEEKAKEHGLSADSTNTFLILESFAVGGGVSLFLASIFALVASLFMGSLMLVYSMVAVAFIFGVLTIVLSRLRHRFI